MKKYDLVIAGCGIAGAVAGLTALKKNLSVCIVEKAPQSDIGKKVCGELTTREVIEWLHKNVHLTIENYPLRGLKFCTSSGHTSCVPEPLCTIDRWQTGQIMISKLLDEGADILYEPVTNPVGTSSVRGVKTTNSTVVGSVTIDCTGVASTLYRKFTSSSPRDLGLAYKETLELKEPFHEEYAMLYFNKNVLPAGYVWCFPKNLYQVNVGAGGLVYTHDGSHLKQVLEKALKNFNIVIKKRTQPGLGIVPLGKPLPNMTFPGLLVCGDAASQVNPLTGEGIAPAVCAGHGAGVVAAKAVQSNDMSVNTLWEYNERVARTYGIKHAPLVVARDFLISLSNHQLTYILENITSGEDLSYLIKGRTPEGFSRAVKTFFKTWRNLRLLYQLYTVFSQMNAVRALYQKYPPSLEEFPVWEQKLSLLLEPD